MISLKTETSAQRASPVHAVEIHAVDILAFIEAREIPAPYLATPYRLAPEQGGEQVYALLCDELRRSGKVGIAHVVIGTRPYLAVLMPQGEALTLTTLHWAGEAADGPRRPAADSLHASGMAVTADARSDLAGGFAHDGRHAAFQPGHPALTEHAMKDKKFGGFAADELDSFLDDDELVDEKYLMPSLRRSLHRRDGHAMRRERTRQLHPVSRRSRGR